MKLVMTPELYTQITINHLIMTCNSFFFLKYMYIHKKLFESTRVRDQLQYTTKKKNIFKLITLINLA